MLGGTLCVTIFITHVSYPVLFLVFPFLLWAALRFGHLCAASCVLVASVSATFAAAHHVGPFAYSGLLHAMLNLQLFNGTIALTALLLAAVITERDRTRRDLQHVAENLTAMADELEHGQPTLKSMVRDLTRAQHGTGPTESHSSAPSAPPRPPGSARTRP